MARNITAILNHLNLPKYDVVRDMIRAQFAARVKNDAGDWFLAVKAHDAAVRGLRFPYAGIAAAFLVQPKSVENAGYYQREAAIRAAVFADEYKIDAAKVQKAADHEWMQTKAFYAARVGEKIDALLEGEAKIECNLELSCFLVGTVTATLGEKVLVLSTSLKTNYRYGVFAANRQMTVYRQVPTLVFSYKGFDLPAREAQIIRETQAMKTARVAAIGEWQHEIYRLEKQKRVWDDTYFSLNWSKKREDDGRPGDALTDKDLQRLNETLMKIDPSLKLNSYPTWEEAKSRVKVLREALKNAKLKLREVRQPKMEAVS